MTRLTFHIILHTHWDREWYLPRAGFQARLVPALGTVLDLLEQEPDARFTLDGQTVLAEDALDVRPDWIPRVVETVAQRRLEVGPWYILADELVPTGESLVRNLLQGARDAGALGARMDVLYTPDAFGHPAILPTLAAEFGIATGVAWRGLGRPAGANRDLYRWRGPDGAELLLYHLPTQGYEIGYDLVENLEEGWTAIRDQLVSRAVTSHIAIFLGADHHAPPADPGAIRDQIHALESGNFVRISSLTEFFDAVRAETPNATPITGELRWSYGYTWTLQGTHATRSRLKRHHGGVELYLQRQVEPLVALARWHAAHDEGSLLRVAWRTLLQCQFHDTLCGCCSDVVAAEQQSRLGSVHAIAHEIGRRALDAIFAHDPDIARKRPGEQRPSLLLWNPVPRSRGGVVTSEVTCFRRDVPVGPPSGRQPGTGAGFKAMALVGIDGREIPVQVLSVRPGLERIDAARHYPDQDQVDRVSIAFEMPETVGLGFACLRFVATSAAPRLSGVQVSARQLENRFVTVRLAGSDRIEVIDRRSGEHYVNVLKLVDQRDRGDTYTPCIADAEPAARVTAMCSPAVLAAGPLVGALERRLRIRPADRGDLLIRLVLMLYADSPAVRVRLEIDNQAVNHRLRATCPVGSGVAATAGTAFGVEHREPVAANDADYPAERPARTAPAHRYVAAGNGNRGLALLCPGFLEYEFTGHRELSLTLLRATGELSRPGLVDRPGHAGWPMATPDAQEPGVHVVDFAIVPLGDHEAEDVEELERMWEDTFLPAQPTFVRDFVGDPGLLESIGATLEGAGLIFTALKPAESGAGFVLRCYNAESTAVSGRWVFRSPIERAARVRADEFVIEPLAIEDRTVIGFTAPPRGIVSILISPP